MKVKELSTEELVEAYEYHSMINLGRNYEVIDVSMKWYYLKKKTEIFYEIILEYLRRLSVYNHKYYHYYKDFLEKSE